MESRNEEVIREILEQSLAGYWDWDIRSNDEYLSPAFKRMFGYDDHELPNRAETRQRLIFPEDLPGVLEKFRQHVESRGRVPYLNEVRYRHKNGSTVWAICTGKVIEWDAAGNPLRMVGCHVDITERKRAEEALRTLSLRQEAILEAVPDIIAQVDMRKVYTWLNRAGLDFFGDDAIGHEAAHYFEGPQDTYSVVQPLFGGDSNIIYLESWQRRRDGKKRLLAWWCRALKDAQGKVTGALSTGRDITEIREAEAAVRFSEQQLKTYFEGAADAIYVFEPEKGRILSCNDAACRSLGYSREELLGVSVKEFEVRLSVADIVELRHRIQTEKRVTVEGEHKRRDGSTFEVEVSLSLLDARPPQPILAIARDITVRKRTEEALVKAQKLEALGILAGGIAHDFNNLLGGIFGYIDLAATQVQQPEVAEDLKHALATMERARGLTRQLLTFSKGGTPRKKIERLVPFLESTARFALSGSQVSARFRLPQDLWPCEFDKNQIAQVIDNIVINAVQANPGSGTIEVVAENLRLVEGVHATLPGGDYVRIAVTDHGIGMPREILPKIFDPFFTTKTMGHGLGLATCYSIVRRHGGCIDVQSEPGKGSTFTITLPASPEATSATPAPELVSHQGSGSILVMDDEPSMREAMRLMLEDMGYVVCCVADGREAVERFRASRHRGEPFAAVILDLTVPGGLGGRQSVAEMRTLDKDTPIFVTSGYAEDPVMAAPEEAGFTASLCKPFVSAHLAALLNTHLRRP